MTSAPTHRDRFAELSEFRSRFDRTLDDLTSRRSGTWSPPVDIVREDGGLLIREKHTISIKPTAR